MPPCAPRSWAPERRSSRATSSAEWRPTKEPFPCEPSPTRPASSARPGSSAATASRRSSRALDYARLLARVREVVEDVRAHSAFRPQIDRLGVAVHERAGAARFSGPHEVETESGLRLAGGQDHPLHGRNEPAPRGPRLRVDEHAPGRLGTDIGSAFDAGRRRGRDREFRSPRSSTRSARGCSSSREALASCRPRTPTSRRRSRRRSARRASRCTKTWIESTPSRRRHPASG